MTLGLPHASQSPGASFEPENRCYRICFEVKDDLQALLHSYCCLDFASILDVTQLRLHRLRKLMKDRVHNRRALSVLPCRHNHK